MFAGHTVASLVMHILLLYLKRLPLAIPARQTENAAKVRRAFAHARAGNRCAVLRKKVAKPERDCYNFGIEKHAEILEVIYMDSFRVLEIKKSVFENNDREADLLREELKQNHTFLLNLMSSPGSGKTTTLMATINALKDDLRIGVMEADIDSDVDAATISTSGAKVIQLHTGGMCHLDAGMTRQGLEGLGTENIDLAILENVGNLVCPAEFDTGAVKNAMILSVPEGDDKPLKYPLMFSICDVLLVNKIDVAPYFNFSLEKCIERVKKLNPNIQVFPISALKGEGIEPWANWLREQTKAWNA
jgi:hydrogenase nickel incorporation protein HypB